jgi:energy-coupling factor transporter ATP-binding protein EcfA2
MALVLTWRAVAKLKNSADTNLLILDEIFDSSLDNNGAEELMKILHSLDSTNVFVISHRGDILQDKFQSVIRFEKQQNFSHIIQEAGIIAIIQRKESDVGNSDARI